MRDEAIVANCHKIADEGVGLNPATFAYRGPFLYLHEWANKAVISNRAPVEIDRLHDVDVLAELNIDNPRLLDFGHLHTGLAW